MDSEARARLSGGTSESAIYKMIERAMQRDNVRGERVADVGCGAGALHAYIRHRFQKYIGIDVARYSDLPEGIEFIPLDLNSPTLPLENESVDVAVSAETIEHLENPRALMRQLSAAVKPNGWVIVTTPNQLSFLSLVTLIFKNRFSAFQDVHYPAHLTALLEVDLRRMAAESGLTDITIGYSLSGRMILTPIHYPLWLSKLFPKTFSDNVLLMGRKKP